MNAFKNTEDEDPFDLNSPLSAANGKNPFKVDDSYFNEFNAKLNDQILELEELQKEAPVLASLSKYNPFDVPTGYFDEFPSAIQQLITTQKSRISFKEWLFQFVRPNFVFPVSITIILAFVAINTLPKQTHDSKNELTLTANLSIEEQLYSIDESILVDMLNDKIETEPAESTDETITNYLIENNVDEATLKNDINITDHENH